MNEPNMTVDCPHANASGPCINTSPHPGDGRGCVHESATGSWVPDRHDKPGRGDGE